jgi:hypothetical protein
MSIIVRFKSDSDREAFVRQARVSWPELLGKTHLANRRPDMVIDGLMEDDISRLQGLVGSLGTLFGDFQLHPTGGS